MKNTNLYAYFGHHKCATNWIKTILTACCNSLGLKFITVHSPKQFKHDITQFIQSQEIDFIAYTNAQIGYILTLKNLRAFHVVRDPRDLIVSAYFSHKYSHSISVYPALIPHREKINLVSKNEGLLLEMKFSKNVLEHMNSWQYYHPHILEIKMEDLIAKPQEVFTEILAHLGLLRQTCLMELAELLYKNRFSVISGGRKQGDEDSQSHYRKGVPGDWKNYFNEKHKQYFKKHYNGLLLMLGYEKEEDW